MDALLMAVWRRGKADALLHHLDQGSQSTCDQFQRLPADNSITCLMSRAGNVRDNSAMASFFSSPRTNGRPKRSTAPATEPVPTSLAVLSASTTRADGTPNWAT